MNKPAWFYSLLRWLSGNDPYFALLEQHNLLIKTARRCAYDLKHCVDGLPAKSNLREFGMEERANFYIGLFQSGNSMKDYRIELIREIEKLEDLLKKNGINKDPF